MRELLRELKREGLPAPAVPLPEQPKGFFRRHWKNAAWFVLGFLFNQGLKETWNYFFAAHDQAARAPTADVEVVEGQEPGTLYVTLSSTTRTASSIDQLIFEIEVPGRFLGEEQRVHGLGRCEIFSEWERLQGLPTEPHEVLADRVKFICRQMMAGGHVSATIKYAPAAQETIELVPGVTLRMPVVLLESYAPLIFTWSHGGNTHRVSSCKSMSALSYVKRASAELVAFKRLDFIDELGRRGVTPLAIKQIGGTPGVIGDKQYTLQTVDTEHHEECVRRFN